MNDLTGDALKKAWDALLNSEHKVPLYVARFDMAGEYDEPDYIYFCNHYPSGDLPDNIHRLLCGMSGGSRSISPDSGGSSSGTMKLKLASTDNVVTEMIQSAVGNLQNRRVVISAGYEGMPIDSLPPIFKGRVHGYSLKDGTWEIQVGDSLRELQREVARQATEDNPVILKGHPLVLLLGLLLSKKGDRANSRYDYLPEHVAAGIDEDRVDIAGIEQIINKFFPLGSIQMKFTLKDRTSLGEFLKRNICQPMSCYLSVDETTGKICVIPFKPPITLSADRHLKEVDMIGVPELSPELSKLCNEVKLHLNHDGDDYRLVKLIIDAKSVNERGAGTKALEIKSKGLHQDYCDAEGFLSRTAMRVFDRYSTPPIALTVKTTLKYLTVTTGDIILVSHSLLPDIYGKHESLHRVPMECLNRTVNWQTGEIQFKLLQSAQKFERYSFICPDDIDPDSETWFSRLHDNTGECAKVSP